MPYACAEALLLGSAETTRSGVRNFEARPSKGNRADHDTWGLAHSLAPRGENREVSRSPWKSASLDANVPKVVFARRLCPGRPQRRQRVVTADGAAQERRQNNVQAKVARAALRDARELVTWHSRHHYSNL